MSTKERRRLVVLGQVRAGRLTMKAAGELLGISGRQASRLWKRCREVGDGGLVHGLRGRPGNRRGDPALRARVVTLCREHYADFGCTLACEYLFERHGLVVDDVRQESAGEGSCGADERDAAGPAGQGVAGRRPCDRGPSPRWPSVSPRTPRRRSPGRTTLGGTGCGGLGPAPLRSRLRLALRFAGPNPPRDT